MLHRILAHHVFVPSDGSEHKGVGCYPSYARCGLPGAEVLPMESCAKETRLGDFLQVDRHAKVSDSEKTSARYNGAKTDIMAISVLAIGRVQ
jgi:hypothetical protein